MKNLTKQDLLILLIAAVLFGLIGFFIGKHIYKCKPQPIDAHAYDSLINERDRLIDSVKRVTLQYGLSVQKHDSTVNALKKEKGKISNETNQQYEKIYNASDSEQRIILCRLLSDMRQYTKGD